MVSDRKCPPAVILITAKYPARTRLASSQRQRGGGCAPSQSKAMMKAAVATSANNRGQTTVFKAQVLSVNSGLSPIPQPTPRNGNSRPGLPLRTSTDNPTPARKPNRPD